MSRVHVAPSATANSELEVCGAPPLNVVPSEQARLQPTAPANDPREQVIAEEMIEGAEGGGGGGGGEDGGDGGGAEGGCSGGESGGAKGASGCGEGGWRWWLRRRWW